MRWFLVVVLLLTGCVSQTPRVQPHPGGPSSPAEPDPPESAQSDPGVAVPDVPPAALEAALQARIEAVLRRGSSLEGERVVQLDGQTWRSDCSGFVAACYADEADLTDADLATPSIAETMWKTLSRRNQVVDNPRPGDLVFFDNTYDRNSNGRRDDPLSHVGLVESVAADGTVAFLHFGSGRVKRDVLNLNQPSVYTSPDGTKWNSFIRRGRSGDRLTGQLFRGFARPLE